MIKKTIDLQTLLNLTDYLEKEISRIKSFVLDSNMTLKSKSAVEMKEKVRKEYHKRKLCYTQLQIFKLAKTEANSKITADVSNNARIYELSDLKRDGQFISSMLARMGKTDKHIFYVPKSELEDELQKIEDRMSELKDQMSDFNESFEVTVEIDENLDLI